MGSRLALAAMLVVGWGGCWVKEEIGNRMQADIAALQVEMDVVKKAHAQEKADLQQRIKQADQKIAELEKIIEDYRRATGRNAADVGVEIEKIRSQMMEVRGRVEVNEHRLEMIEQRLSTLDKDLRKKHREETRKQEERREERGEKEQDKVDQASRDPLEAIKRPANKKDFYQLAYRLLEAGQTVAARTLFQEFSKKWPSDAYSDNALYWIGESYYVEKEYREAALTFQKVRQEFPGGDKAPDALLKLGFCFFAMEKYREALPFLQEFVRFYPKSSLVAMAKKKIQETQRMLKQTRSR